MAKDVFNEAERFLIQHWWEALELEQAIDEVRVKYQSLCEKVAETVRERHDDLEKMVEVTRISGPVGIKTGVVVLGKRTWPREKRHWTGFWIEHMRLEYLVDESKPPPLASLWISTDVPGVDFETTKQSILVAAEEVLTAEELGRRVKALSDDGYVIGFEFVEKQALIDMLHKGDTEGFIEAIVAPLDLLAKLTPALDAAFPTP